MKRSIRSTLLFVLVLLILTACDGFVEVGVLPTATPVPTPTLTPTPAPTVETYTNEEYGFTFQYPSTWMLVEEPHAVRLGLDSLVLTIQYGWAAAPGFSPMGGRTGMPAGTPIYSAKVLFLDQVIPGHTLEHERKAKMALYGETGLIEVDDLAFSIWLEDLDSANYLELDIPQEVQDEAKAVLESFARVEATGQPPAPTPTREPTTVVEQEPASSINVVGWYGSVHSAPAGSGYDDYLSVLPEGAAQVGLVGTYPAVKATIDEIRDKEPPNKYAHFWGILSCGVDDYGGCQLQVTHVRPDGPGPLPNPDPVEGWEGTIITNSAWAQIDDAFVLSGDYPVHYGIWSEDPALDAQIQDYRNAGITIRVWGQVFCGIPDANGCQIQVQRLEEASGTETPTVEEDKAGYENAEYGFSFQVPDGWTVEQVTGETTEDGTKLSDAVILTQDKFQIAVQYLRKSDPVQPGWDGRLMPGDLRFEESVLGEKVTVLGIETHKRIWTYGDELKAVFLQVVSDAADLVLQVTLADGSVASIRDEQARPIPDAAMQALDHVLVTMTSK